MDGCDLHFICNFRNFCMEVYIVIIIVCTDSDHYTAIISATVQSLLIVHDQGKFC